MSFELSLSFSDAADIERETGHKVKSDAQVQKEKTVKLVTGTFTGCVSFFIKVPLPSLSLVL